MFIKFYGWDYLLTEGAHNNNEVFLSLEEALITPLGVKPDWMHIAELKANKFSVIAEYKIVFDTALTPIWTSSNPDVLELISTLFNAKDHFDEEDDRDVELIKEEIPKELIEICRGFIEQVELIDSYSGTTKESFEQLVRKHAQDLEEIQI